MEKSLYETFVLHLLTPTEFSKRKEIKKHRSSVEMKKYLLRARVDDKTHTTSALNAFNNNNLDYIYICCNEMMANTLTFK